jgi:hypothetical protein
MVARSEHGRTLRATLCEIELGLFYVTYPSHTSESNVLELPTYGLGTCASQVKQRMEKSIHEFGYAKVMWENVLVLPPSHSPAPTPAVSGTQARPFSG